MKYFVMLFLFVALIFINTAESFAEEIKIKFGETVQYDNLNLYFYDIEDSRCPLDVTCIWEGKVTARIHTSNQTHKIGGGFEIDYPLTYMTPYTITLIDVKPHPISTEKPDYVAILDISKTDENLVQIPPPENDAYPYVSNGFSKLQKAIREDIPIGNHQFKDVVHGGGIANGNLHITINPDITDPAEQEEIFQELVVLLGFDSFEINFAKPTQQVKALCESPETMLVDGVCQKIVTDKPESFTAEQPPEWLWFAIGGMFMLGIILLIWRKRK